MRKNNAYITFCIAVSAMLLSSGCSSSTKRYKPAPVSDTRVKTNTSYKQTAVVRENTQKKRQADKKILDTDTGVTRADKLVKQAKVAPPEVQATMQMRAAEIYIEENQSSQAKQLVQSIDIAALSPSQKNQHSVLKAKSLVEIGQYQAALNLLAKLKFGDFKSSRYQAEYLLNVSRALMGTINPQNEQSKLRKSANAMDALVKREPYLIDETAINQNRSELWRIADTLSTSEIEKIYATTSSPFLRTWLESSIFKRNNQTVISGQNSQPINNGNIVQNNPQFETTVPTVSQPPIEEQVTVAEPVIQPEVTNSTTNISSNWNNSSVKRIALLLPLSSQFSGAARAFEDGFKTAHRGNTSNLKPQISVYNIDTAFDVQSVLGQAISEGADFVVGPLGKSAAQQVLDNSFSSVPILALGGAINNPSHNRSVFTLSPEQEAYAIAKNAVDNGYYRAAVLAPTTARGARLKAAFESGLRAFGGSVVSSADYDPNQYDHGSVIKNLLSLDASTARHNALSTTLGFRPKFTPARRSDVDFLLLAGNSSAARIIKPQLSFYQAHSLPTYSTSRVFSGAINKAGDADLENIIFPEMPWLLKQMESGAIQQISSSSRLYAFGHDAYNLIPIMNDLKQFSGTSYLGLTGELSVNARGEFLRRPAWAKFKKGIPTRLEEGASYSNYGSSNSGSTNVPGSYSNASGSTEVGSYSGPSNSNTVINRSNRYDSKNWDTRKNRRASSTQTP